jgi:hypothetical protein
MRTRITVTDLRAAVDLLNRTTNATPGAIGSYVLEGAYGGWQLQRIATSGGGIRNISYGFLPARELLERISFFRYGYELAEANRARAEPDTATCDGCENAYPVDQVDVLGNAEHGFFGLCHTCKAKDAAATADCCPVTGDTYGLPA